MSKNEKMVQTIVEDMKTVKKIKHVLKYIFLAIGTYFTICVLGAG